MFIVAGYSYDSCLSSVFRVLYLVYFCICLYSVAVLCVYFIPSSWASVRLFITKAKFYVSYPYGRGSIFPLTTLQYVMNVLPVVWMTSYFHIMEQIGQNQALRCFIQFAKWRHRGRSLPSLTASYITQCHRVAMSKPVLSAVLL